MRWVDVTVALSVMRLACCTVVSIMLLSVDSAAQGSGCCESYYYCYDLAAEEQSACELNQTRTIAEPYACNQWTRQCDIPTLSADSCLGDCNKDGAVDVSEVIRSVNFALGSPSSICPGFGHPDGTVPIDGIIRAVNHALGGCPGQTVQCGGGPPRIGARLCGPADRPCVVLADNTLPGAGVAIAVDRQDQPHTMIRADDGKISYGQLSEGAWQTEQTGFSGLPVWLDVTDAPLALVGGDHQAELWQHTNDGWQYLDSAPGVSPSVNSVQRDAGGCIHVLSPAVGPGGWGVLGYGLHTDFWSYFGFVNKPGENGFGGLGLDGLGDPVIAYWQPDQRDHTNRTLLWRRPAGPGESVADAHSTFILDESVRVAFSGTGEGQPHLLATRSFSGLGDQFGIELIYATRPSPGAPVSRVSHGPAAAEPAWSVQVVAQGSPDEFNPWRCEAPPSPGSVCRFSYDYVRAVGLVASGNSDVRLFYVRQHVQGQVTSECSSGTCTGRYDVSSDGTLYVAWPENGSFGHAVVLEHVPFDSGTTVLDSQGRIHILATSRYLMLGRAS